MGGKRGFKTVARIHFDLEPLCFVWYHLPHLYWTTYILTHCKVAVRALSHYGHLQAFAHKLSYLPRQRLLSRIAAREERTVP